MGALVQQLPTLIGVILGAFASYATTTTAERARWKRRQSARWDERRMAAYADYGDSEKKMTHISSRIIASRGLPSVTSPLSSKEGLELLGKTEMERSSRWESVLLLGGSDVILAAREWHECVWTLERFARGELDGADEYEEAYIRAARARVKFYMHARTDLGVMGDFPASELIIRGHPQVN